MVWYIQSNRYLWKFWAEKLQEVKLQKGSTFPLTFGGENLIDFLEKEFGEEKKDFMEEMENFVYETCRNLYDNATDNISPFPTTWEALMNELPVSFGYTSFVHEYSKTKSEVIENYRWNLENNKKKKELENLEVIFFSLLKAIGYRLEDEDFPPEFEIQKEYKQLETQLFRHLKKNVLEGRSISKILKSERRLTKRLEKRENQIRRACDLSAVANIPNGWENFIYAILDFTVNTLGVNDLNNLPTIPVGENLTTLLARVNHACPVAAPCALTHCPNTHANYNTLQGESAEYQRIQARLNGQISNNELDSFVNHTCSTCSHTDYDTIKTERNQLKTEQQTHEQAKQQAIQAKETEIINKIITDLQLSTEREREREREHFRSGNYRNQT